MKIKRHSSSFLNSDYGKPEDVELVKKERIDDKWAFIYRVTNQKITMREGSNRYMGSFYYEGKWYSIIKYFKDDHRALGYYININKPPTIGKDEVEIEDLFLDIWVNPDFSYEILDLEELNKAKDEGIITNFLYDKIIETKEELIGLINNFKLPDDFVIEYTIKT